MMIHVVTIVKLVNKILGFASNKHSQLHPTFVSVLVFNPNLNSHFPNRIILLKVRF